MTLLRAPAPDGRLLPVPWIIRWSAEQVPDPGVVPFGTRWGTIHRQVEPDRRGQGQPQWAHVHSDRAFHSVRRGLCQVCGQPGADLYRCTRKHMVAGDEVVLTEAPTCARCVPLANRLCPDVRRNSLPWWRAEVTAVVAGGAFGKPGESVDTLVLLVNGQPPPPGTVLKQPYPAVRFLERVVELQLS